MEISQRHIADGFSVLKREWEQGECEGWWRGQVWGAHIRVYTKVNVAMGMAVSVSMAESQDRVNQVLGSLRTTNQSSSLAQTLPRPYVSRTHQSHSLYTTPPHTHTHTHSQSHLFSLIPPTHHHSLTNSLTLTYSLSSSPTPPTHSLPPHTHSPTHPLTPDMVHYEACANASRICLALLCF